MSNASRAAMRPTRSLYLVPANTAALVEEALAHRADAVILDLESTVSAADKAHARQKVGECITRGVAHRIWVRVNSVATEERFALDIAAVIGAGRIDGLILPNAQTAAEIRHADESISALERERGLAPGCTALIVQLDNAKAVFFAHELAAACTRVVSLCFNGAQHGELVTDLGCIWSSGGPEVLYSRQYALVAARAAGIGCPLDGAYANIEDTDGFIRDTELSRRLGYRGRVVIDPRQIEAVNRIYSPSLDEVEYHQKVLETFRAAVAQGKASVTLDGKMIDYAHEATARAVLAQAKEIGVIP